MMSIVNEKICFSFDVNVNTIMKSAFKSEENRLKSLENYPFNNVEKRKIAKAGFFWCFVMNSLHKVSCFECSIIVNGFNVGDDPWRIHMTRSPECAFVKSILSSAEFIKFTETFQTYRKAINSNMISVTNRYNSMNGKLPECLNVNILEWAWKGAFFSRERGLVCFYCDLQMENYHSDPVKEHLLLHNSQTECLFILFKFRNLMNILWQSIEEPISCDFLEMSDNLINVKQLSNTLAIEYNVPAILVTNIIRSCHFESLLELRKMINTQMKMNSSLKLPERISIDGVSCSICFTNPIDILLLPCKHVKTCFDCVMQMSYCPICRQPIEKILKIYI